MPVDIPPMGESRMPKDSWEMADNLGVNYLQYMSWVEWMYNLSRYKVGYIMSASTASGSFALNCAYLGIPCIGYNNLDTQRRLHPMLSVDEGDLITAKKRIHKLWNDKDFYEACSETTKELYKKLYSKESFLKHFNENIR